MDTSIQSIDGTLTGTTTSGQSRPGSKGNKGVLYISRSSRVGRLTSNTVLYNMMKEWIIILDYRNIGFFILSLGQNIYKRVRKTERRRTQTQTGEKLLYWPLLDPGCDSIFRVRLSTSASRPGVHFPLSGLSAFRDWPYRD